MDSLDRRKRSVAYGRVSTLEQAENQRAAEQQIERLRQANVDEIYFDIESGDKDHRYHFERMVEAVMRKEIGRIIATRWDRLTRNQAIYLSLKEICREHSVEIYLLDQGLADLETASGELHADMQVLMAVYERRMLIDRVRKGFKHRRDRVAACARAPWGYITINEKYVLDRRPIICLRESRPENYRELSHHTDDSPELVGLSRSDLARELITLIFKLKSPSRALREHYQRYGLEVKPYYPRNSSANIAKPEERKKHQKNSNLVLSSDLRAFNAASGLKEWLGNPVLRGHTAFLKYEKSGRIKPPEQWEMHLSTHPDQCLLTEEEYKQLSLIFQENRRKIGAPGSTFYLTGLIYCDHCGYKMVLKRGPEYAYYGCRHASKGCINTRGIRLVTLDEAIIAVLFQTAHQMAEGKSSEVSSVDTLPDPELSGLLEQLETIDKLLAKGTGNIEVSKQAKYELEKQIANERQQLQLLTLNKITASEVLQHTQARDIGFWHTRTLHERELFYDKLLKKVLVRDGAVVSVELKFTPNS